MERWFWAELIDLVGHDDGHILLAVGFRYSIYVRRTCIPIGTATYWGIYLRSGSRGRKKIFICVPTTYSATGEQPLGLRWSIACCCVYSEFAIVWLWVRWWWIPAYCGYGGASGGLVTGRLAASFRTLLTVKMTRWIGRPINLSKNWIIMMKYIKAYIKVVSQGCVPSYTSIVWTCK